MFASHGEQLQGSNDSLHKLDDLGWWYLAVIMLIVRSNCRQQWKLHKQCNAKEPCVPC